MGIFETHVLLNHHAHHIQHVPLGVVFLMIFRSIPLALIALVPNILTTLAILGIIGWAGIPLDIMTITIAAIAMGIAVDDTLHFVHSYREANQEGAEKATRHAFRESGLAILITTSLIAIGFSLFAWSALGLGLLLCGLI